MHARNVFREADGRNRKLENTSVGCYEIVCSDGLADDGHVGSQALPEHVSGAHAALQFAKHTCDHQIPSELDARLPNCLGSGDERSIGALHVVRTRPVKNVTFYRGDPRIALPPLTERVHIEVSVKHEAAAAAGAPQGGDRLIPAWLDLLQIDFVPAVGKPPR
jgi:hypothetical protein